MASYCKRIYKSWRVSVEERAELAKAFDDPVQAQAYVQQLKDVGRKGVLKPYTSTGWQARIRNELAPGMTETFPTKAKAEEWAKKREGEIVTRLDLLFHSHEQQEVQLTLGGASVDTCSAVRPRCVGRAYRLVLQTV